MLGGNTRHVPEMIGDTHMRGSVLKCCGALTLSTSLAFAGVMVTAQPASAMSISSYQKLKSYPFWHRSGTDPLKYYKSQCVSFAGWWLLHHKGVKVYHAGNAVDWKAWAKKHHYTVNHTPSVGSVAWWNHKTYGHVAIVLKVNKKSIVVGEGNWNNPHGYGTRTINKGSASWPKYVLHIGK